MPRGARSSKTLVWVLAPVLAVLVLRLVLGRLGSPSVAPVEPRALPRGPSVRESAPARPTRERPAVVPASPSRNPEPSAASSRASGEEVSPEPRKAEARAVLARTMLQRGRKQSAERLLKRAVRLDPANPRRYAELALLEQELHHDRAATKHLQIAIALSRGGRMPETPQGRLRALAELLKGL